MATAKSMVRDSRDIVDDTKKELEERLERSRESIAHTVTDIKEAVSDQYESIKQGISDTFDWREQFRKHPVAWMVGSLAVGYVLGNSIAAAYKGTKSEDQLLSYLTALGERLTSELGKQGMNILIPSLTGTILAPIISQQLQDAFGIDLSDLSKQLLADLANGNGKKRSRKSKKKSAKKLKKARKRSKKEN